MRERTKRISLVLGSILLLIMLFTQRNLRLSVVNVLLFSLVFLNNSFYQQLNSFRGHIGGAHNITRKKFKLPKEEKFEVKDDITYRQQVFMANYRKMKISAGINCTKIINNDQKEILKSEQIMRRSVKSNHTQDFYWNITQNCKFFRESRGYIEHPLSKTEFEFPIAFSILVYKDIEQVERLLRSIYRPHNFYCIHMDLKMPKVERDTLRRIVDCLDNVFIAIRLVDVKWGDFTLLEAELVCMETLWAYKQWKYYINLAGQEFPLKTNREIVAILKSLDGANVVDGSISRAKKIYSKRWSSTGSPPPHKIELVKGSMHIAANRYFVDFCLHDQRSLDFIEWLKKTKIPDETFFSSLNHNPHLGIIGSFLGEAEEYNLKPYFLRHVIWQFPGLRRCFGKFVREVCIIGVKDLQRAYYSIELFANKFYLDYEHIALDCLEEVLYEKTWKEYIEDIPIDTSYYRHLHYGRMQLKP